MFRFIKRAEFDSCQPSSFGPFRSKKAWPLVLMACVATGVSMPALVAAREPILSAWNRHSSPCKPGVYRQPKGPFAVVLYCEESLGNYLGILYLDPLGGRVNPVSGLWAMDDRYWYRPEWGADVTGFAWSADGRLFVSSNNIYGEGSLYEVDPLHRRDKRLLPASLGKGEAGPGYVLYGIDPLNSLLRISPGGRYRLK